MNLISTTDLTKLLGVTPQRVAALSKQLEIPDDQYTKQGRTKYYSAEAVKRILSHRGLDYDVKKILAFCNNKGGVGKSTVAINTAMRMADLGFKVLIIDADPQSNTTSFFLPEFDFSHSLYDVVKGDVGIGDALIKLNENLHIIPSTLQMGNVEKVFPNSINQQTFFRNMLKGLDYNYIIWDLSPSLGPLNLLALMSCDQINIVTVLSNFSIQGLEMTNDLIAQARKNFSTFNPEVKALINMFDSRITTSFQLTSKIKELDIEIFKDVVRVDNNFNKAQASNQPLPKNSKAIEDINSFVEQLIGVSRLSATIQ